MKYFTVYILFLVLISCAGPASQFSGRLHKINNNLNVTLNNSSEYKAAEMTLQYLGVGGFVFEINGERLITSPSYTNPPFLNNLPFRKLQANNERINHNFPDYLKDNDNSVKAILVGHSHYDHLLDIPYLMEHYLTEAKAYGSTTMSAILNNFDISCDNEDNRKIRAISVNKQAEEQKWIDIDNANIKILPLLSSHAPHFLGMTFQTGYYECGDEIDLKTAWDWKMGNVYAYLIDFMDDQNEILFRVYYQDSANDPDSGLIPLDTMERKVDIAILTLAGSNKVKDYPASRVQNTGAELFIIGHWEDFFDNYNKEPVVARGSNETNFITNLEKAIFKDNVENRIHQWLLPSPLETFTIQRK